MHSLEGFYTAYIWHLALYGHNEGPNRSRATAADSGMPLPRPANVHLLAHVSVFNVSTVRYIQLVRIVGREDR